MSTIAVVGTSGRVGSAVASHLSDRHGVISIARRSRNEDTKRLASRALADRPALLVNAAGVAHVERSSSENLARLFVGNVDLPAELAAAALEVGASMIHVSSVKAEDPGSSPYAESKRRGEDRLKSEFAEQFAEAGLSIVILRPLALLLPPLDAGKVARLGFLRWWPSALVPPVRVPALATATFLSVVEETANACLARTAPVGVSVRRFEKSERCTLRDVGDAFRSDEGVVGG